MIRHAEAEGNIYRRAHGHYNGLVTLKGHKQIELLKERFAGERVDAVYSSDLSRAVTTAAAIAGPRNMQISTRRELREVDMGSWEDRTWGDLAYSDSEMNYIFNNDPEKWQVEGGERYENVFRRVYNCISEIARQHDGGIIAVFSHGFAIRTFLCRVQGIPSNEFDSMPYCDNTAVTLLLFEDGAFKVEYAGDNSHLGDANSTLGKQSWWRAEDKRMPENLRHLPLGDVADSSALRLFKEKAGERASADTEYASLMVDEPVGILGLDTRSGASDNIGRISYIYVAKQHRKRTYGVQLIGLAVSDFRKLRREKLQIDLPSGHSSIAFFIKCGFYALAETGARCLLEKDIKNW